MRCHISLVLVELEVARVELGVVENETANVEIADVEVADMGWTKKRNRKQHQNNIKRQIVSY